VSRRLTLVGAAAFGALLPLLAAAPATAAETGAALISLDGTSFERAPQGGIFPDRLAMVPGGTATGTFYVKNDSERTARLRISVSEASSASGTFLDALSLRTVTPGTPDGAAVRLSGQSACIPLLSGELLPSQQVTAVHITLAMDSAAGNVDQGSAGEAALVVSLSDPVAPDSANDCTDGGGIPLLPSPAPRDDGPMSDTTDMVPAIDSPQPTAAAESDGAEPHETGVATPAAETPPTAGALPLSPTGSPLPLPWLGTGGLLLGAAAYLFMRSRRRRAV
jgi:hypothetical protein